MFKSKEGIAIPAVSAAQLEAMRQTLQDEYGLPPAYIVEGCAYSMAMVVRHALGLSAEGARVAAFISDSFPGWIALATIRHLVNAGSAAELIFIGDTEKVSEEIQTQFKYLDRIGLSVTLWTELSQDQEIAAILESCHNCVCGTFSLGRSPSPLESKAVSLLNELNTPIYAIECPMGIHPDTGKPTGEPLYASCSLSLGAPLAGMFYGHEHVGRHYLCDTSFSRELYHSVGMDLSLLFATQPVQQIFPDLPPEE